MMIKFDKIRNKIISMKWIKAINFHHQVYGLYQECFYSRDY